MAPMGQGKKPLEEEFIKAGQQHRVTFLLLPLPKGARSHVETTHETDKETGKKKKLKVKKFEKNDGKAVTVPEELKGYSQKTADGKYICWNFNMSRGCKFAGKNGRCKRGVHVCMKCHSKNHALGGC